MFGLKPACRIYDNNIAGTATPASTHQTPSSWISSSRWATTSRLLCGPHLKLINSAARKGVRRTQQHPFTLFLFSIRSLAMLWSIRPVNTDHQNHLSQHHQPLAPSQDIEQPYLSPSVQHVHVPLRQASLLGTSYPSHQIFSGFLSHIAVSAIPQFIQVASSFWLD
jgi:hypothetical protein